MSFILKTFSKKALAVVCTVALLLTVVSVCFSAIALTPAEFTVTAARPAIPAKVGKGIDLKKIDVQFSGGTQNGADITWESLDTTGGISVDDTAKTAIYLKKGIYAMKATYGTETKNVYVMEVGSNNETVLYEKVFSAADLDNGAFKADSEWTAQVTNNEALGFHIYFGSGLCLPSDKGNISATYYIKPNSAPGKMISDFSDLTVEYNAFSRGVAAFSGPLLRVNLGDNGTYDSTDAAVYPSIVSKNSSEEASWLRIYCSGTKIDGDRDDLLADDTTDDAFHYTREGIWYTVRAAIQGTALKLKYTSPTQTASYNVPQAVTVTAGGTVGVSAEEIRNASLKDFKVLISFTADEVAGIDDYLFDVNMIAPNRPAIPAKVNTMYDLGDLYFAMSNGSLAKGSALTWTTSATNVIISGAKVAVIGEGIATLTGTDASSNTTTLYVMTVDNNNEVVIFDYTFSAADAGLAVTDSNGKPIWSYSGTGSWDWVNNAYFGTSQPRLRNDGGAGIIYLNPESEQGKIVSSFSDYTFYLTAVTHENWLSGGKYFPMLTRYNMAGADFSLTDDTYLGYRAYFSTNGGSVYVGGAAVSDSTATYPYVSTAPHVDFKMQVDGTELIFSAKPFNVANYTQVYKMSTVDPAPAAAVATAGIAGTIGVYTDTNNRPSLQKAKVVLSFDDSEFLEGSRVISEAKPFIPAKVDTLYDIGNGYFALSNNTLAKGSDLTWTTTDSNVTINGAKITVIGEGVAKLVGTDSASNTITVYVTTTNDNHEGLIYEHAFSEADVDTTTKNFIADSDWTLIDGAGNLEWNTVGGVQTGTSTYCGYALKPTSEGGKLVSAYRDVVIEANIAFSTYFGAANKSYDFSLVGRANWANNSAISGAPATYAGGGYNGFGVQATDWATLNVSGTENLYDFTDKNTAKDTFYNYRVSLIGNDVKIAKNGAETPITLNNDQLAKIGATNGGTIYLSDYNTRLIFKDIKVYTKFAESDYFAGVKFVTLDKPTADTTVFTYNGEDQTYTVADNAAYTVSGNVQKNAGTYTVTVALKDKNASVWADGTTDDVTFDFIIGRKNVTVKADAASKEFGKTDPALTFTAEGLVGSDTLTGALTRAAGEAVGSYEIQQGTVNNDNNPNYNITFVSNTFKVTKTNQAAIEITNKPSGEIVYGDEFILGTTGGNGTGTVSWAITAGDTFATVDAAGKVTINGVGQVTVTATKAGDNDYEPTSASYTFTSVKATPVLGQVTTTVVVTNAMLPSQVTLTKQSGPAGTLVITDSAMLADKTSYSWKFTPDDTANYNEVTGNITITVADKLYPTAQIKVDGDDATADSNISFSIIGKTEKEVTITAADEEHGSGIAAIKYAVSSTIVDVTELDSLTYAAYNGAFKVSEGKSIVYVQVTDNAGNTSYYASEGIIVDGTAPVIKDVEDGDEFDGNKVIEVEDALSGIASVKVDGDDATVENGKFTAIANDAERTITVTDKAGNVTEIKITLNKVYTATFKGENGVITTITLKPGEALTMPAVPTKEGYTVKWEKTVDTLTEDIVINAVYTKIEAEKEEDKKPDSPKTGDITNLWFWVVVLVVSGVALTVSLKAKKVR